jgi:hypothetical protein
LSCFLSLTVKFSLFARYGAELTGRVTLAAFNTNRRIYRMGLPFFSGNTAYRTAAGAEAAADTFFRVNGILN